MIDLKDTAYAITDVYRRAYESGYQAGKKAVWDGIKPVLNALDDNITNLRRLNGEEAEYWTEQERISNESKTEKLAF